MPNYIFMLKFPNPIIHLPSLKIMTVQHNFSQFIGAFHSEY